MDREKTVFDSNTKKIIKLVGKDNFFSTSRGAFSRLENPATVDVIKEAAKEAEERRKSEKKGTK